MTDTGGFTSVAQRVIVGEVLLERIRQDRKWGVISQVNPRRTKDRWLTIQGEEYGEAAEAVLERDPENERKEWVQMAAVALARIEHGDLNGW